MPVKYLKKSEAVSLNIESIGNFQIMSRKRKIMTRSQSNRYGSCEDISAGISPKKICLPMGDFSALPIEIIEEIVSSLPISGIISLASTSRQWLEFIQAWLASSRVSRVMIAEIRFLRPFFFLNSISEEKKFISWCTNFGDLVRVATLFNKKGEATRISWLRRLMTELRLSWRSFDGIMRGFSGFLNSCFKSSDPKELAKIIQVVTSKIRMKTYINTQLKYKAGNKKSHEARTRQITRFLFTDYRLLVASLMFFTENGNYGRRMTPNEIARLIFVIYGPFAVEKEQIDWKLVSRSYFCSSFVASLAPLAHFLNMSFWRKEPFCIEAILEALLGNEDVKWSENAIGALFVNLDIDLSVKFLLKNLFCCADVVVVVGMHSPGTMEEFLDRLKSTTSREVFQEVCTKMSSAISKEIKSLEKICKQTCQDCTDCLDCPLENLKKIQKTTESFFKPIPVPPRRSLRLQRQGGKF